MKISVMFPQMGAYTEGICFVFGRCPIMGDIDDLIFGDEDNGPSER